MRPAQGVETALKMIVSGEPVKSEMLAKLPGQKLFDKIVEGDVVDAAVAYAREKADVRPLPLVRNLKVEYPNADAYFQFARNTVGAMSRNFPAPLKCIDAVAASTKMKFDDGMKLEREIFLDDPPKAFAWAAGPCSLCRTCDTGAPCKHADRARPSMEACGIDVFSTARRAGFPIHVVRQARDDQNYFGLIGIE